MYCVIGKRYNLINLNRENILLSILFLPFIINISYNFVHFWREHLDVV